MTNTVNIAMELSNRKDIHVFVPGGHLRGDWFSLVGSGAVAAVSRLFVDVMFIGVNGIHPQQGLTCLNAAEAELNAAMVGQAKRKVAVADHSRIGVVTKWLICPADTINALITDSGATEDQIAPFVERGIEVQRVQ